jgi:SAM-dependent methyltransferase
VIQSTRRSREGQAGVACPLCRHPAASFLSFDTYDTHLCPACDHRFNVHSSKPLDEEVYGDRWLDGRAAAAPVLTYQARSRMAALRAEVPAGSRLLEVGCGTGEFLDCARRAGFDAFGLDTSPGAIREVARIVGEDQSFCGLLSDLPDEVGGFDVIAGFHVLEHVPDPVAFAESVRDRLVPGGLLYLRVPNARSLIARLRGRGFYIETHISHFSSASLRRSMESAGFVDARVWTRSYGGRWFELLLGPALTAAGWIRRPLNRRAFGSSESVGGPPDPSRSTRLLRAVKRSVARQYQLAGLATHLGGYPLWSAVSFSGLGGELAITARRAGGPAAPSRA